MDTTLVKNPEDKLQNLLLDLDDDLFWFSFSGKTSPMDFKKMPDNGRIELWEVYRAQDTNPIIKVINTIVTVESKSNHPPRREERRFLYFNHLSKEFLE